MAKQSKTVATNDVQPFGAPGYAKNSDKCGDGQRPCGYCGKAVKGTWKHAVRIVDGGARFATKDEQVSEAGDMGCWPVGSDCAKRLIAANVPVFAWEEAAK